MKAAIGEQMEFEFPVIFSKEEMGVIRGDPKTIILFGKILWYELKAHRNYPNYENPNEEPINIICPFCEEGYLELKKVEPIFEGYPYPKSLKKEHVGNNYEYKCTECDAKFLGGGKFVHIGLFGLTRK